MEITEQTFTCSEVLKSEATNSLDLDRQLRQARYRRKFREKLPVGMM